MQLPDFLSETDRRYVEKSGLGERMGWGEVPALLVVDMTYQFTSDDYSSGRSDTGERAVEAIAALLEVARDSTLPVFYTRRASRNPAAHSGVWRRKMSNPSPADERNEIAEALAPREEDVVLEKGSPSAFFDTPLAAMLRHYGVDTVVLTGMVTSGCVRATAVDACSSNFRTIIPREAVADRLEASHEMTLFELDWKYVDVEPLAAVVETFRATLP